MTLEQLIELEKRATPAPWEFRDGHSREGDSIEILMAEIGRATEDEDPEYGYVFGGDFGDSQESANWQLTKGLRNAAPAYFAALKAAKEYMESWKTQEPTTIIDARRALRSALTKVEVA